MQSPPALDLATPQFRRSRLRVWLPVAIAVPAIGLAAYLIQRKLSAYSMDEIAATVAAVPLSNLLLMVAFAAASYLCLTGFDYIALRFAGHPLPYRRAALASFTSLSLGHNIGFAALSSGTIRYRFYSRWGLGPVDVGKVILFCGLTVGLGLAALAGVTMLLQIHLAERMTGLGAAAATIVGILCLALPALYLALSASGRRRIRFRQWSLDRPNLRLALLQVALGVANFAFVAACLHQALAATADVSYPEVAMVYVVANTAAILTHVPGGLGVIEGTVLFLLPDASLFGPVLLFRCVYFLVPLCLGLISLSLSELLLRRVPRRG